MTALRPDAFFPQREAALGERSPRLLVRGADRRHVPRRARASRARTVMSSGRLARCPVARGRAAVAGARAAPGRAAPPPRWRPIGCRRNEAETEAASRAQSATAARAPAEGAARAEQRRLPSRTAQQGGAAAGLLAAASRRQRRRSPPGPTQSAQIRTRISVRRRSVAGNRRRPSPSRCCRTAGPRQAQMTKSSGNRAYDGRARHPRLLAPADAQTAASFSDSGLLWPRQTEARTTVRGGWLAFPWSACCARAARRIPAAQAQLDRDAAPARSACRSAVVSSAGALRRASPASSHRSRKGGLFRTLELPPTCRRRTRPQVNRRVA